MPRNAAYLLKSTWLVPFRSCTSNNKSHIKLSAPCPCRCLPSYILLILSAVDIWPALGVSGSNPNAVCVASLNQKSLVLSLRRVRTSGFQITLQPKYPCLRFKHAPHLKHPMSVAPEAFDGVDLRNVNDAPSFTLFRIALCKTPCSSSSWSSDSHFRATGKLNVCKRCIYRLIAPLESRGRNFSPSFFWELTNHSLKCSVCHPCATHFCTHCCLNSEGGFACTKRSGVSGGGGCGRTSGVG